MVAVRVWLIVALPEVLDNVSVEVPTPEADRLLVPEAAVKVGPEGAVGVTVTLLLYAPVPTLLTAATRKP
jgi:hypothetical protein